MRCESASRGQKFSKSKNFSTFFKTCLLHVSGLWDNFKRKKFFSEFHTNPSPGIVMRFERQKLPFTCNQRGGLSLFGSHGKGTGARVSHCDARVPVEVKNFLSQKIFQLFLKHVCSTFQDSGIILSGKNFFRISHQSESRYRNEIRKAETPLYMKSERGTLPVRITWKGDWSLGVTVSLRCESASRGQKFSKSKNFSTFFKTCLLHVSGLWDNFKRKNFFPNFTPIRVPVS